MSQKPMKYVSVDANDMDSFLTAHHGVPAALIQQGTSLKYGKNTMNNDLQKTHNISHLIFEGLPKRSFKNTDKESVLRGEYITAHRSCLPVEENAEQRYVPIFRDDLRKPTDIMHNNTDRGMLTRNYSSYKK